MLSKAIGEERDRSNILESEVEALKNVLMELEDKNRRLSDKLNEVIFSKASVYREKTIETLKRGGNPISP